MVYIFIQTVNRGCYFFYVFCGNRCFQIFFKKRAGVFGTVGGLADGFAKTVQTDHTYYYVCKIRNCRFPVGWNLQGFSFRSICFDQHNITKWNQFLQCGFLYGTHFSRGFFNIGNCCKTVFFQYFRDLLKISTLYQRQHGIICHMGSCGNNHFFTQSL